MKAALKKVRFGIVGMGIMGANHAGWIVKDKGRDFCLAAVCDIDEATAARAAEEYGVPYFTDVQEMYDSGLIDAVIIATVHYWHPSQVIRAARAGIHVLCEKPLAVTVGAAQAMIAECKKHKVAFGAMLQMRTGALMKKMKQIVDSSRLGEIFRVSMIYSDWYRTQFYYDSGAWRGTWDGEGGGILLNQAPHSLDLFQWIGGMPKRVIAALDTRLHKIEVENTASAICQYDKGRMGYFYATTAEAPGTDQLMVCGDKGTLVAEGGKLRLGKLKTPISKHITKKGVMFGRPECTWQEVKLPADTGGGHILVIRAFAKHILRGTPMVATGQEAINELELSNAMYISGFKNKAVELPVNAAEIDRLIATLSRKKSTGKGGGLRTVANRELAKLLRKKPTR